VRRRRRGSNLDARRAFAPLFERYGVQLVVSGHDHDYQRSNPIALDGMAVAGRGMGPHQRFREARVRGATRCIRSLSSTASPGSPTRRYSSAVRRAVLAMRSSQWLIQLPSATQPYGSDSRAETGITEPGQQKGRSWWTGPDLPVLWSG
jgi:hypothetical protein